MENNASSVGRRVRAIHINLSCSTPAGLQRMGEILRSLLNVAEAAVPATPTQAAHQCSICREDGADCKLPCQHTFHRACLMPWLVVHSTCASPYCDNFYVPENVQEL